MGKEGRASQSRLIIQFCKNMDWEMLPDEVWSLIGSKLDVAADRVRFRAVCKSWTSLLPFPPPIWLMIPQYNHHKEEEEENEEEQRVGVISGPPPRRGFVIAGERQIYHLDLPKSHEQRCVGSTGTCFVTVDLEGNISVFNPFSGVEISLPSQSTLEHRMPQGTTPEQVRDSLIAKIVLSSTDINCVALAIHLLHNRIAIARPGDASWTLLDTDDIGTHYFEDIIFFKGKFYVVNSHGFVMVIDTSDGLDTCVASYFTTELLEQNPEGCPRKKYYLVEWMGELVLVVRHIVYLPRADVNDDEIDIIDEASVSSTWSFQVYKLNLQNKHLYENNWIELNSLGEYSLFLGLNTSVCVRVCDYNGSLNRNCIYFTDDYAYGCLMAYHLRRTRRGLDMGVYDLESKIIQPCYRDFVFPSRAAPIWVVPTLHTTERATEQDTLTPT